MKTIYYKWLNIIKVDCKLTNVQVNKLKKRLNLMKEQH